MEGERTNLVPRLQQDAYLHGLAAAQPGALHKAGGLSDATDPTRIHGASGTTYNHSPTVGNRYDIHGVQSLSTTPFPGSYRPASFLFSGFPYSVGNPGVVNEYNNNSYSPSTEGHTFEQGLPVAGISNRYLADSVDFSNTSRFDANASLSAQPHAFSTGALSLTSPTYAESGYGGIPAGLQYYSDQPTYNERPFNTEAASIGNNTFATASANYTNGQFIANSSFPMAVSNNSVVPTDLGLMTESPITLLPNNYTTGQASAINPYPMPTFSNALIPVDGPPSQQRPSCSHCNETFSRQSDLERHAKKHGPKNIKCQVQGCKYRTYRNDKLGEHMRRRHPAAGSHSN